MTLDTTGLDNRIFTAFSETSVRRYIFVHNLDTDVVRWSANAVEYFDLPGEYMSGFGKIWTPRIHPDDLCKFEQDINAVFSGIKKKHYAEYRVRNKNGNYVFVTCRGVILKGENGESDLFAGTLINHGIADFVDPVTGLYNHYKFLQTKKELMRAKQPMHIMLIGLNNFSDINFTYNFFFGNIILNQFATKIRNMLNESSTIFRMEGPRFAIISKCSTNAETSELYTRIQELAKHFTTDEDVAIPLTISGSAIQVTDFNLSEQSVYNYLSRAYADSKYKNHSELVFYDTSMQATYKDALVLLTALRQSIADNCEGFYLNFQPLINPDNNGIIGAEALLRYKDSNVGEVPPGKFIPLLEEDACFFDLGTWILREALTEGKSFLKYNPDLVIDVNLSYTQISQARFRDVLIEVLNETGFPVHNLCLELTESCRNLDIQLLREEVLFYKSLGIKVAMDDFGTGTSCLALLRDLPVDCLKLDQSFILNLPNNNVDEHIVDAFVQCAHKLKINVCLEGVENKFIRSLVEKYKVKMHQGYLYSRPVPLNKYLELLQNKYIVLA
ncbi:MAG: EAL domain-containing protein [Phascolarctobacterium sp.]|nr:EAL domain-containing protein [Phascolarctobacterium sp.]